MLTSSGQLCLSEPWNIASSGCRLLPAASTGLLSAPRPPHSSASDPSKCQTDHVSSLTKASVMVSYCSSDKSTSCLASHLFPLHSSSPPTLPYSLLLLVSALAASSAWNNLPPPAISFLTNPHYSFQLTA